MLPPRPPQQWVGLTSCYTEAQAARGDGKPSECYFSGYILCKAREREGFILHSPDALLFPLRHKQEQETAPTKSGEEGW